MTKDNSGRREPFIAKRDESGATQVDLPIRQRKPVTGGAVVVNEKRKFGFVVLCFIVGLLMLSLAALSAYSWQQGQAQQRLQQRFDDMASRLESSDESVAQSGAALAIKLSKQQETLATHWSEIKKLWGVTNDRNKKAIKALQLADGDRKKGLKKINQSQVTLRENLKKSQKDLVSLKAKMTSISRASLAVSAQNDDVVDQLQGLGNKFSSIESDITALQKLIEKNRQEQSRRFIELEQAVKSMDAFRKQTNEKFSQLQQVPATP